MFETADEAIVPQTPRGELLADPTAKAIWAALCTLQEGVKHQFLAELRAHLAVTDRETPHKTRLAKAVASLNEAAAVLRAEAEVSAQSLELSAPVVAELTESAYAGLYLTHREHGWMAASSIRRTFGGQWNDALREARLQTVSDGEVLTKYLGRSYEWDEVCQALVGFCEHRAGRGAPLPEDFSLYDYFAWARRPDILRRAGRRPRSQAVFDRFGGFARVKAAVFAGGEEPTPGSSEQAPRSGSVCSPSLYRYTDAHLKAAVDEIVVRLGRSPRAGEFQREQALMLKEEAARGLPRRAVPSYNTISKCWKLWDAALVAYGHEPHRAVRVDPESGRGESDGPRPHIPDEDVLAGIAAAYAAKGKPFNMKVYGSYFKEQRLASTGARRLASYACIYQRYRNAPEGPWKHACDKVLPAGWDKL